MNPFDHIEDYLQGTISNEQKASFEAAMIKDEGLRKLVKEYQVVKTVSEGLLEEELLGIVQRVDEPYSSLPVKKRWWILALIGVLVIFGGYYIFKFKQKQNRINQAIALYERPENRDIVRSEDPESLDLLARGKYYFELNRFKESEEVLVRLIKFTANRDTIDLANYWLGHVYFNIQEWEKAESSLKNTSLEDSVLNKSIEIILSKN